MQTPIRNKFLTGLMLGLTLTAVSLTSVTSAADMVMEPRKAMRMKVIMKHVTPMPGLMGVARQYGDELGLNEEQKGKMAQWYDKQGPVVGKKARMIYDVEQAIRAAALSGKSAEEIEQLAKQSLELRQSIIDIKIKCRNNLRKILNDQQWNKLIEIAEKTNA